VTTRDELRDALHALLRDEVGADRVVRLCPHCGSSGHGRPRVLGVDPPHLSLAYADDLAVVAWSREGPVGVDVERDGPPVGDFGDRQTWTRVEALLKATGEVLRRDPADLPDLPTVELDLPAGYVGTAAGTGVSWRLAGPAAPPRTATG
jgi:4'-phosphopantetheinyl transferase